LTDSSGPLELEASTVQTRVGGAMGCDAHMTNLIHTEGGASAGGSIQEEDGNASLRGLF